jgi:hypothetical protein
MTAHELTSVRRAARARVTAEQRFRESVLAAHGSGETLRAIAEAAGLSHVRVLQIVRSAGPVEQIVADDLAEGS